MDPQAGTQGKNPRFKASTSARNTATETPTPLRHACRARTSRPGHALRQWSADTHGTRANRRCLIALLFFRGERRAGVGAERSVEPVDRLVAGGGAIDDRARVIEASNDLRGNIDRRAVAGDRDGVRDPDMSSAQRDVPHRRASRHGRVYLTMPLAFRKSRATSFGSSFSPSTL
jgi:hypothetical protein